MEKHNQYSIHKNMQFYNWGIKDHDTEVDITAIKKTPQNPKNQISKKKPTKNQTKT